MSGTDADPRTEAEGASYVGAIALNYRLVRKLGEGGFGAVYLAEHVELGRRVACKILHPQFARDPSQVERFFREARAVCAIGHATIAAIENFGRLDAGEPFYLMEFFPGQPLSALAAARRLDAAQLVAIFDPIVDALGVAHAKGIIHRDLKPDNIMVMMDGARVAGVRLLDFGIAKLLDAVDGVASLSGFPMGTPAYMAPEQALDSKSVDLRADVYAFGATVFATIAGRPPFVAPSVAALLLRVQTTPATALRELVPSAPEHLDRALARCLEKAPDARPPSVAAAWAEIRAALLFPVEPAALVVRATTAPGLASPDAATALGTSPRMWQLPPLTPGPEDLAAASGPAPVTATPSGPGAAAGGRRPWLLAAGAFALVTAVVVTAVVVAGRGGGGDGSGGAAAADGARLAAGAEPAEPPAAPPLDPAVAGVAAADGSFDAVAVSVGAGGAVDAGTVATADAGAVAPVDAGAVAGGAVDAGSRRRTSPPPGAPRLDCSDASFASVYRAAAPSEDDIRAALRRLKQCEAQLDATAYRRIQTALIARQ